MTRIYREENQNCQFDFSKAVWASDELHEIYHKNGIGILSDADFIAETESYILLVEYKNANISNAVMPEKFNPLDQRRENKIAFKFYDSWIYLTAIQKEKPIKYIYVLEYPNADVIIRKRIRNQIANLLPFELQKRSDIKRKMIHDFEVLSIDEWNRHEIYKNFPITKIAAES